ncbi:hypothetical protein ACRQ5D_32750 [Mucilaginibacter sp. P25]|uniref:hypothetical protein n=1 Tax=Mucilaginibacter sp. P25 TaxID=3423945 RepID=UPI003D792A3E
MSILISFGVVFPKICLVKQYIMSRELIEFSDRIDELFDHQMVEPDDFWEQPCNLFI